MKEIMYRQQFAHYHFVASSEHAQFCELSTKWWRDRNTCLQLHSLRHFLIKIHLIFMMAWLDAAARIGSRRRNCSTSNSRDMKFRTPIRVWMTVSGSTIKLMPHPGLTPDEGTPQRSAAETWNFAFSFGYDSRLVGPSRNNNHVLVAPEHWCESSSEAYHDLWFLWDRRQ